MNAPPAAVYEARVTDDSIRSRRTIAPRFPTFVENLPGSPYRTVPHPVSAPPTRATPKTIGYTIVNERPDGASSRTAEPDQPEAVMSQAWERKNDRRVELIGKRSAAGLTAAEEAELARLQDEVFDELDAVIPLPFDALAALEAEVSEIQARIDAEAGRP